MRKKQLWLLFSCRLVSMIFSSGVMPLLPLYAAHLGAGPSVTGYYLAFCFFGVALGSLTAGWLSDKFQRRKLFLILVPVVMIPPVWLMGQVTQLWQLVVLNAIVWFVGGVGLALTNILAGLFAGKQERGKVFGILGLTSGLGALLGGSTTGPLLDRWGYATLFAVLALIFIPRLVAALFLEDKRVAPSASHSMTTGHRAALGRDYYFLFFASLLSSLVNFMAIFVRSLAMYEQGYSATAISSTVAVAGLLSLPIALLIGSLSDRLGRKVLLILFNLGTAAGIWLLIVSTTLWHFWLAVSLSFVASTVITSLGSALVTDLVAPERLGRGMARFNVTQWVGGVLGFGLTGYAVQTLGMGVTTSLGAGLALMGALLLLPLREPDRDNRPAPSLSGDEFARPHGPR